MSNSLEGRVALVTGAGSGIGRAAATLFAREGAKVVVAGRRLAPLEETVRQIEESGGDSTFIQVDVSQTAEVERMVGAVVNTYGRLDCALNNASVEGPLHVLTADFDEEEWDRVIGINLKGTWLCLKYEIPQMLKQGGGVIVNVSSTAGLFGSRFSTAYGASKHGIIGLTKTAALEYGKHNIRVNVVIPGSIDTPMAERIAASRGIEYNPSITDNNLMSRRASSMEVAEAVVWMCTDAASFVTGHSMAVDGGESV